MMHPPKNDFIVDAELLPYFELFLEEGKVRGIPMIIRRLHMSFVPKYPNPNTLAQCQYGLTPHITISREFWDWADAETREQVVFHEFGHCVFNRDHLNDSVVHSGQHIPRSLMQSTLFSGYYYTNFREYYVDELFGRSK